MTTLDRLCAILAKDYAVDAAMLTPDASLEALGIDSLGVAELLFNVEDEFRIDVPSEPVELSTIADVVRYIEGLVLAQHSTDAAVNESAVPMDEQSRAA